MQERALPRPALVQAVLPQTGLAREVFVILGFSALVAVSAQIAIPLPFTPVPITGQTFAVLLAGAALGSVRGSLSLLSYVGVGALGVPVYTWAGGPASWGYLPGFVLAAFVVGWLAERGWDRSFWSAVLAMLAGNVVLYIPGLIWLSRFVGAEQALPLGLLPFIPGDVIKLLLAAAVLPSAWVLVRRTHLDMSTRAVEKIGEHAEKLGGDMENQHWTVGRTLAGAGALISMFAFFMPWVSCGSISLSGMDLAGQTNKASGGDPVNTLLFLVPLASALILGNLFVNLGKPRTEVEKSTIINLVAALAAGGFVLLYLIGIYQQKSDPTKMMGLGGLLKVEPGVFATIGGFAVACFGAITDLQSKGREGP